MKYSLGLSHVPAKVPLVSRADEVLQQWQLPPLDTLLGFFSLSSVHLKFSKVNCKFKTDLEPLHWRECSAYPCGLNLGCYCFNNIWRHFKLRTALPPHLAVSLDLETRSFYIVQAHLQILLLQPKYEITVLPPLCLFILKFQSMWVYLSSCIKYNYWI